jgi:dihydropteroate synthase
MNWTLFSTHGREWDVERCMVMGIVNATPDSFSDGGLLASRPDVSAHLAAMVAAGADILDIGGQSTRPGHVPVSIDEEIARVIPVIEAARDVTDAWISIDTARTKVARIAMESGADFVNDVSGLSEPGMARLVANRGASIVLMRDEDCRGDIVASAQNQLRSRIVRATTAGISEPQIIVDPGLGFGTRPGAEPHDNLQLIDACAKVGMGWPVLIGASRKRFVGAISTEGHPDLRDAASHRLAVRARDAGAAIVRVHDVAGAVAAFGSEG